MNCNDDWIDSLNYSIESLNNFKKEMGNWLDKNRPAYKYYSSTFGRKNARCVPPLAINPELIKEISYENGNITFNCEVGEMNSDNLFRLASYLRDNGYDIIDVTNSMIFALSVVRIRFWVPDCTLAAKLPEVLNIDARDMFVANEGLVFIKTRAFFKYYNDDGQLQLKQFDLMDYEFEQRFTTLNPISCRLREHGIKVDVVDIWDDFLMIKCNQDNTDLCMRAIKKALNMPEDKKVYPLIPHKVYAVDRWK